jgi:hypothetical protein
MKTTSKILIVMGLCFALGFVSCKKDSKDPSTISLDRTEVTGNVSDNFTVRVTTTGDEITTVKVTKFLDGKADANFAPVTLSSYEYVGSITLNDASAGAVLYTFTGYDAAGTQIDAADLTITVNLTGVALLLKYDWQRTNRIIVSWPCLADYEGEQISEGSPELEYVQRFNSDYSYQFDWGNTIPDIPSIYCAWTVKLNQTDDSKVDSLIIVKYDLSDERKDDRFKVTKLTSSELWLETSTDFICDLVEEQRYKAIPKSPNFTPYRGVSEEELPGYTTTRCQPGTYE